MCSQVYSVGVAALKDNCSSNESDAVTLKTGKAGKELKKQGYIRDLSLNNSFRVFIQYPALRLSSMSH